MCWLLAGWLFEYLAVLWYFAGKGCEFSAIDLRVCWTVFGKGVHNVHIVYVYHLSA